MSRARALLAFAAALLPLLLLDRGAAAEWMAPVSRAALAWMGLLVVAGAPGAAPRGGRPLRASAWLDGLLLLPVLSACLAQDLSLGQARGEALAVAGVGLLATLASVLGRGLVAGLDGPRGARARATWSLGWWAWVPIPAALWIAGGRSGQVPEFLEATPLVRLGGLARVEGWRELPLDEALRASALAALPLLLLAAIAVAVGRAGGMRPLGRSAALLACLAACAGRGLAQEPRLARVTVSLEGPLERLEQRSERAGGAVFELALSAGERRELELFVPVAGAADVQLGEPQAWRVTGSGRVRVLGWAPDALGSEARLALPVGLRARPRPVPGGGREPAPAWLIVGLLGLFLPGWWLAGRRGRGGIVAALAGVGAAALAWPQLSRPAPEPTLEVLEGDLRAGGAALEVRTAAALHFASAAALGRGWLEASPAGIALELRGRLDPLSGELQVDLCAPGGSLHWLQRAPVERLAELEPLFAVPPEAAPGASTRLAFERGPQGLRPIDPGRLPPWLVSGLPAGLPAVLVRGAPGGPQDQRFVRVLGPAR